MRAGVAVVLKDLNRTTSDLLPSAWLLDYGTPPPPPQYRKPPALNRKP